MWRHIHRRRIKREVEKDCFRFGLAGESWCKAICGWHQYILIKYQGHRGTFYVNVVVIGISMEGQFKEVSEY